MTTETLATPQRAAFDPYAPAPQTAAVHFLYRLNPLAKLAGPLPAMVLLVFVRDLATPVAFLALAYVLLLVGARLTWRTAALLFLGIPLAVAVLGFSLSLWTDASRVDHSVVVLQAGDWVLYGQALAVGFGTALRLAAILALSLIPGLTTTGPDLVRSLIQQLRVPYRIGYTAMAAFRFVPRFRHELDVIRAAHRVRGAHGGRGPFAVLARGFGYVVPLLAGAIRHAERVALAMDARAFGAYPTRTERYPVPFRGRDAVFIGMLWLVSAVLFALWFPWSPA
ncbi:energy-coupling factor transporter transmembrane component T family protein [Microbacterium sp.]|uniref:energy-coupling factor transporter transmembrane component T family protein n=1 Tax=Microbacterium sp. TaxID=51671 RepID=UPI0037CA1BDD